MLNLRWGFRLWLHDKGQLQGAREVMKKLGRETETGALEVCISMRLQQSQGACLHLQPAKVHVIALLSNLNSEFNLNCYGCYYRYAVFMSFRPAAALSYCTWYYIMHSFSCMHHVMVQYCTCSSSSSSVLYGQRNPCCCCLSLQQQLHPFVMGGRSRRLCRGSFGGGKLPPHEPTGTAGVQLQPASQQLSPMKRRGNDLMVSSTNENSAL